MSEYTNPANPKPPAVDRLSQLWRRVYDHKLVQWTVAYVALAYGIQHGVTLTSEAFEWPHAFERVSMLLLTLGFPLAVTLAWYHGHRANRQFSHAELSILSALLVIGAGLFYVFAKPAENTAAEPGSAAKTQAASVTGLSAPNAPTGISIAVLPFANLSDDRQQEFFSDGMTDEIMTALAKVPALRVVGRESAFQFKGQKTDMHAVGQALGANYLVEGSVRKAGDQVRITAQLVKADNGVSLWTDAYDRELKNIFATQSDIAQAVASALRVPLGLKQGESLVSNRTTDLDSYQQYLRARALLRARAMDEAVTTLEGVVARDPGYAPAWALLPRAYSLEIAYNLVTVNSAPIAEARRLTLANSDKIEKAAREAIRLDPKQPGGYLGLAVIERNRGNPVASENLFQQALALDPSDPESLDGYSQWLFGVGRVKDSLRLREQLRLLEPFVPIYNVVTAFELHADGQNGAAMRMLEAIPSGGAVGERRNIALAEAYAAAGRYSEAADTLLAVPQDQNRTSRQSLIDAARLLRTAPAKVSSPETLPLFQVGLGFVYLYVGAPDHVMDRYERVLESGRNVFFTDWAPEYAPVRKTERFKAFARKTGLVDYWKARGWPDLCHPIGAGDFACN